jgi:YbgC/YbaW family acyl-CoA thioester hydrolase
MTDDVSVPYVHVVRYHEVDAQGHVYHSRYLEIADAGFSDYLAALLGTPYSRFAEQGFDPAVIATQIEFRMPARYEDRLTVTVLPTHVGRTSFRVSILISRDSDKSLIATLSTTYVNFDVTEAQARAVPGDIADLLRKQIAAGPSAL